MEGAYDSVASSSVTAVWSVRSSLWIEGGFAREKPVPTVLQPALLKADITCRPSRPVAPVMRTVGGLSLVLDVIVEWRLNWDW